MSIPSQPLRICFLNAPGILGGAEQCLLDLAQRIPAKAPGAQVKLLMGQDGPLLAEAARRGVDAETVPMPEALAQAGTSGLGGAGLGQKLRLATRLLPLLPAARAYALQLRRHVEAFAPTVIHSNSIKTHLLSRWLAVPSARMVWHVHDFLSRRGALVRALRWSARGGIAAVANSRATALDAERALGMPVRTVLNAIDLERFAPGRGDGVWLDRLAGLPPAEEGVVRVGLVATYARWKGQDLFLEALARLKSEAPAVRGYIVGGPVYATSGSQFSREELRERAKVLGVAGQTGFVDFQADTPAVYRALDIVVQASTAPEPFGLTIAEAMACARPVVVAKAGGAEEIFSDGHDAVGFEPGKADDLAAAIRRLAGDASIRRELGARARQSALKRFSLERLVNEMLNLYQSLA